MRYMQRNPGQEWTSLL